MFVKPPCESFGELRICSRFYKYFTAKQQRNKGKQYGQGFSQHFRREKAIRFFGKAVQGADWDEGGDNGDDREIFGLTVEQDKDLDEEHFEQQ